MFASTFTQENIDTYLKELGKEFKRRGRGAKAELILIGGGAVLVGYGFREMTMDIDTIHTAGALMKEAANAVGDKYHLPNGWLNSDFMHTSSYTPKLAEHSTYYKTFANVLEVRIMRGEYLIAMKLVSGRRYKKDLSDIVGVLMEHQKMGNSISYEQIDVAMINLYGDWSRVDEYAKNVLMAALEADNLEELFTSQQQDELNAKDVITDVVHSNEASVNEANANEIIAMALAKKKNE